MKRDFGSVTEDSWRRSEAMEVCHLTIGVLSQVSSHLSFVETSGGLAVGRVGYDLVDSPMMESMLAFFVAETQESLYFNWTKL